MNSIFRKLLQVAVVAGMMLNTLSAYDLSKKTTVSIFKGFGKYPYQYKLNPYSNQIDVILYGCVDSNANVKLVKSAEDYASLVPVQFTMNFVDNGTKKKMTYSGFYSDGTYTTKIADSTLRLFGMLPSEDYKKDFSADFLMAEYEAGMPIKMVFADMAQLKAIVNYLQAKFEGFEASAKKPLLLIEIASGEEIEQADLDFLNSYFEVADSQDEVVQKFFNNVEKTVGKLKDFKQVGKSFGDMIMDDVIGDVFDNGDAKKLTIKAIKVFVVAFTVAVISDLSSEYLIKPFVAKEKGLLTGLVEKAYNRLTFVDKSEKDLSTETAK